MRKAISVIFLLLLCGCSRQPNVESSAVPAAEAPTVAQVEQPTEAHEPDWSRVFVQKNRLCDCYGNRLINETCVYAAKLKEYSGQTAGYVAAVTLNEAGEEQTRLYDMQGKCLINELPFFPQGVSGSLLCGYDQVLDLQTNELLWDGASGIALTPHRVFILQDNTLSIYDQQRMPISVLSDIRWIGNQVTSGEKTLVELTDCYGGKTLIDEDGETVFCLPSENAYTVGFFEDRLVMEADSQLCIYNLADGSLLQTYENCYGELSGRYLVCLNFDAAQQFVIDVTSGNESERVDGEDFTLTAFENGNYLKKDGLYAWDGTPLANGYQSVTALRPMDNNAAAVYFLGFTQESPICDLLDQTGQMIAHNVRNVDWEGDFFFLEQGFSQGTIDPNGNWLFRESAFTDWED